MSRVKSPLLVFVVVLAVACKDSAAPLESPLEGFAQVATVDTVTVPPPPPPTAGPGSFHGVVRGYQTGVTDTLGSAVLLANVKVSAFTRVPSAPDEVGPLAASVTTNAQGFFQMPELPGGQYIVTFETPADSPYRSGWTIGNADATSNVHPWWIMLPKK